MKVAVQRFVRQSRALAAMRATGSDLRQYRNDSAAWYVWHPTAYRVRLKLTCRDVSRMVTDGKLCAPQRDECRGYYLPNTSISGTDSGDRKTTGERQDGNTETD